MTANDLRVLRAVSEACEKFDGFIPHGPRDWVAVKRLRAAGLVQYHGEAVCQDCDTEAHRFEPVELSAFTITDAGRGAL